MNQGVLYIAAGAEFTRAANASARSVRQFLPGIAIDIYTDQPQQLESGLYDQTHAIEQPHRRSKVDYLALSRFERTLYLDTDTRIVADVRELFDVLDRFDVALAHAHSRNKSSHVEHWRKPIPLAFPQLNGGVILYKNTQPVLDFLQAWRNAYHTAGFSKDQTTLRELLWDSNLRLHILPPEYNVRYGKYLKVWEAEEATAKILHFREFHDQVGAVEGGKPLAGLSLLARRFQHWLQPTEPPGQLLSAEQKVFGIGFHKTGTSSLAAALRELGYRTIHGDSRRSWPGADEGASLLRMIEAGDYQLPTFNLFDAFTDNPYFSIWQELDRRFDGKFILTWREDERWLESCLRYYQGRRIRPMRTWMFGPFADPSSSLRARQAWLDRYRRHNDQILSHFSGRDNFLQIDITNHTGWDELCPFLNRPIPAVDFPHANKTRSRLFGRPAA